VRVDEARHYQPPPKVHAPDVWACSPLAVTSFDGRNLPIRNFDGVVIVTEVAIAVEQSCVGKNELR
jgi:hypothetical protein